MSSLQPAGCFTPFCVPPTSTKLKPAANSPTMPAYPAFTYRSGQGQDNDLSLIDNDESQSGEVAQSTASLALGILGGMLGSAQLKKHLPATVNQPEQVLHYLPAGVKRQQYLNFNSPLFALVRLATLYEHYHGPLLAYMGAGVLGAVSTSFLQGLQETWVRKQETGIRADLIRKLAGSYTQSIQRKYAVDDQLRDETHRRITALLVQHGIHPNQYLPATSSSTIFPDNPVDNNDALFPFIPGNRQIPTRFGKQSDSPARFTFPWLQAGLFATGTAVGVLLHTMLQWLASRKDQLTPQAQEVLECIVTTDLESTFLHRNKAMLGAVFGLTALAKAGQLLLNTAREVEVTRHNADTELRYQQANWLQMDPRFHALAEQAAMTHDMALFQQDLPWLKHQPALLQERINTLLGNRGRSSPPPYFLATPPVMLTEAKG